MSAAPPSAAPRTWGGAGRTCDLHPSPTAARVRRPPSGFFGCEVGIGGSRAVVGTCRARGGSPAESVAGPPTTGDAGGDAAPPTFPLLCACLLEYVGIRGSSLICRGLGRLTCDWRSTSGDADGGAGSPTGGPGHPGCCVIKTPSRSAGGAPACGIRACGRVGRRGSVLGRRRKPSKARALGVAPWAKRRRPNSDGVAYGAARSAGGPPISPFVAALGSAEPGVAAGEERAGTRRVALAWRRVSGIGRWAPAGSPAQSSRPRARRRLVSPLPAYAGRAPWVGLCSLAGMRQARDPKT